MTHADFILDVMCLSEFCERCGKAIAEGDMCKGCRSREQSKEEAVCQQLS